MAAAPSLAVRLFGTDEPVEPQLVLRAGPLTAELEAGNLRYIRYGGREVLRAISFIVRNRNWGTYIPRVEDLGVDERAERFRVTYRAVASDAEQSFSYRAEIEGSADGRVTFRAVGHADGDFVTNRTGFVVLHPVAGVAGAPARLEHVDGSFEETAFPELIDPVQPMMDIRAISHAVAPGFTATVRMEGEAYEMEDQRNWSDASYKTYVRPLAKPWPYTLPAGETVEQSVKLTLAGEAPEPHAVGGAATVTIAGVRGRMPAIGLGLDAGHAAAALAAVETLMRAGVQHLVCHFDPRRGDDRATMKALADVAAEIGAEAWLELVVAQVEGFEAEVARAGAAAAELGSPFAVVLVSPFTDLKSTLPGTQWPPAPDAEALYRAARRAFPQARIGGGMFSFFTELNRKRPPLAQLDLVTFTTSALVHAGDDRSAMESLEAMPSIAASVRAIAGNRPWNAGPSAIGMRMNPYGAAPAENPGNNRQAMNRVDPRQRGLFNAAFYLGYTAAMAEGGAAFVTLGGTVGEHGVAHAPMPFAQPFFDEAGGVYPAFHVVRDLASVAGSNLLAVEVDQVGTLAALGVERNGAREIWIANLTAAPVTAAVDGFGAIDAAIMDADTFPDAAADRPGAFRAVAAGARFDLPAYAILRLTGPAAS